MKFLKKDKIHCNMTMKTKMDQSRKWNTDKLTCWKSGGIFSKCDETGPKSADSAGYKSHWHPLSLEAPVRSSALCLDCCYIKPDRMVLKYYIKMYIICIHILYFLYPSFSGCLLLCNSNIYNILILKSIF